MSLSIHNARRCLFAAAVAAGVSLYANTAVAAGEFVEEGDRAALQFYDYMDSSASAKSYVDTEYVPNENTVSIEFKGSFLAYVQYGRLFSNKETGNSTTFSVALKASDSKGIYTCFGTKSDSALDFASCFASYGDVLVGELTSGRTVINGTAAKKAVVAGTANSKSICLHADDKATPTRFWYFRVYETVNGEKTLVRDYRPCVKGGVAGYYDMVENKFYASAAGTLTPGTVSPVGYQMTSRLGIDGRSLDGSGNVSLACWTKLSGTGSGSFFNAGCAGGSISGFALYRNGSSAGTCGFRVGKDDTAGNANKVEAAVPYDGGWHHLVGVHDKTNGKISLYVDGSLAAESTAVASSVSCAAICVNCRSGGATANVAYNGVNFPVSEAYAYERALTAAEAAALAGGVMPVSSEKLLVYWPLHQSEGTPLGYDANGKDIPVGGISTMTWTYDISVPGASNFVYDVRTSSRRFTNGGSGATGTVGLFVLAIPEGKTKYQVTAYGVEPAAGGWAECSTVADLPATISFTRPAGDADLAWTLHFANDELTEVESRPMRSLRYTTTVVPVLSRDADSCTVKIQAEGVNSTVKFATYDCVATPSHGGGQSTGGELAPIGVPVAERRLEYKSGPQTDQDDDFNTFTAGTTGDYKLNFSVVNEAGNVTTDEVSLKIETFAQLDHWVFTGDRITDGCFTFQAKVLSEDGKTIQCGTLLTDESNYPPAGPGSVALDFSKSVWNDTDKTWKVTAFGYISGTAWGEGGVSIPHSPTGYEWDCVPNALIFHPDTTTIGDGAFGKWQDGGDAALWANVKGKVVVPPGVTSLGKGVFGCFKAGWIDLQAPGGVSLGSHAFSFATTTNISGKIRGTIGGSTIRGLTLKCPLDLTGVTGLSNTEAVRNTSCPWVMISTNLTAWGATMFNPTKMSGFPGGLATMSGSLSSTKFVKEDGVTEIGTLDLTGFTALGGSKLSGTSGYGELFIPSTLKSLGASAFWNTSITNVTVAEGGLETSVGARALTAKNLAKIKFFGRPPETMSEDFLAKSSSDGKTTLMTDRQVTLSVPRKYAAEWTPLADDGTIPGTITKGSTQKIRFWGSGLVLILR